MQKAGLKSSFLVKRELWFAYEVLSRLLLKRRRLEGKAKSL